MVSIKQLIITITLLLSILLIPGIYAIPQCIEEIQNYWGDGTVLSGDTPYTLRFTPPERPVVIEVIQGGYFENHNYCINVENDQVQIMGWLSVRTAPLQVICYSAADPTAGGTVLPSMSSNGCWQKGKTLQTFSIFHDGKGSVESELSGIHSTIGSMPLFSTTIPDTLNLKADITQKFDNITTDNIWVNLLAWFYFIFGLFLTIRFAFKIGDKDR